MYGLIKNCCFIIFAILFISCSTTSRLLYDGRGVSEVRKNIGRIAESEQSIENATYLIEGYSGNIEGGIEREGDLIAELKRLIQRIRERGDGSSKETAGQD